MLRAVAKATVLIFASSEYPQTVLGLTVARRESIKLYYKHFKRIRRNIRHGNMWNKFYSQEQGVRI
jgi:hypothetical protein